MSSSLVVSVTWSIILICWFAAQETFNISVEKHLFYIFILFTFESMKLILGLEMDD